MNIYQEELMDHFEHPRNQGEMEKPDVKVEERNASCGDRVELYLRKGKLGTIREVKWKGIGCAVSMAAMSKMSEWLKGKSLEEIRKMSEKELLREAIGWQVNLGRRKCVELAVKAAVKVASSY